MQIILNAAPLPGTSLAVAKLIVTSLILLVRAPILIDSSRHKLWLNYDKDSTIYIISQL